MKVHLLACGVFQPELDRVLEQISAESFPCRVAVTYLPARLHTDFDRLMDAVLAALDTITADRIILLFGQRCHPRFDELLKARSLISFSQSNCIELILGDRMKECDQAGRTFYLTPGWLLKWRDLLEPICGPGKFAIGKCLGHYVDRVLYIDTGVGGIDTARLDEFFECTQIPIEIEQAGMATFKGNVLAAIAAAVATPAAGPVCLGAWSEALPGK